MRPLLPRPEPSAPGGPFSPAGRAGLLLASLLAMTPAEAAPARVSSLNLCADELVLRLLPPEQVASITFLGADPRLSTVAERAAGVAINHGLAEEILRDRPDLVVTGRYTTRITAAFLRRLGMPVAEVGAPADMNAVRAEIRSLAAALGVPERGEALVAETDAALAAVSPAPIAGPRLKAIVLNPNGATVGRGSLVDSMITRAGLDNLAADMGMESYGRLPLETVLLAGADILIVDAERDGPPALATELLKHPALTALGSRVTIVSVPGRLWTCGGPQLAEAVARLAAAARARAASRRERP